MISYNDEDKAFAQRIHKELWTKDELKNFGQYCNSDNIRQKFGLKAPENQQEMDINKKAKADKLKHNRRMQQIQMGATMDDISLKQSVWSEVPPSPRAANEKLIWKTNVHEKNKVTRGQNCAVGRLGQYTVGDPEIRYRLDDKMKAATARTKPLG